jgi:hypothetical protein
MRVGQSRSDPRSLAEIEHTKLPWRCVENSTLPLFRTGLIPLTTHSIREDKAFSMACSLLVVVSCSFFQYS